MTSKSTSSITLTLRDIECVGCQVALYTTESNIIQFTPNNNCLPINNSCSVYIQAIGSGSTYVKATINGTNYLGHMLITVK